MLRNWIHKTIVVVSCVVFVPVLYLPSSCLGDVDLPEVPAPRSPREFPPLPPPPPLPKPPPQTPKERCLEDALYFAITCFDRADERYNSCVAIQETSSDQCQQRLDSDRATCEYLFEVWKAACQGELPPLPPGF